MYCKDCGQEMECMESDCVSSYYECECGTTYSQSDNPYSIDEGTWDRC